MNTGKDYYTILGVLPTAEDVVIQAAYRALAQRYHPDKLQDLRADASARMAEINEAYRILSDTGLRAHYDQKRKLALLAGGGPMLGPQTDFAVEQFRPFAEKLHEWGYSPEAIRRVLIQRGSSPSAAEQLVKILSSDEQDG